MRFLVAILTAIVLLAAMAPVAFAQAPVVPTPAPYPYPYPYVPQPYYPPTPYPYNPFPFPFPHPWHHGVGASAPTADDAVAAKLAAGFDSAGKPLSALQVYTFAWDPASKRWVALGNSELPRNPVPAGSRR